MEKFSVKQLAKLAGVSVRTLHHYDQIGLLKPSNRTEANYRYYCKAELLRLQQIMFYKELDIPLASIAEILDNPDFNIVDALRSHRKELLHRKIRLCQLIKTVDNTIDRIKTKNMKMNYEEMYKGFSKTQAEDYEKEARERWGNEMVDNSHKRVLKMTKGEWDNIGKEATTINEELVPLMHLSPENPKVQALVQRHFNWIGNFYEVTPQIYRGLANMYVEDERFKANYDKYKEGLAGFLSKAMLHFAEQL